jgi:hypothetical protein
MAETRHRQAAKEIKVTIAIGVVETASGKALQNVSLSAINQLGQSSPNEIAEWVRIQSQRAFHSVCCPSRRHAVRGRRQGHGSRRRAAHHRVFDVTPQSKDTLSNFAIVRDARRIDGGGSIARVVMRREISPQTAALRRRLPHARAALKSKHDRRLLK